MCPNCGHMTRGDLIVARASAGARRVEAEEAERRAATALKHAGSKSRRERAEEALSVAESRLEQARAEERDARAAEAACTP